MDGNEAAFRRIVVARRVVAERLDAEELVQQSDNSGVFFLLRLRNVEGNVEGGGGGNRGILFALVEAEFGVGLFAAAGGFVEIGTVDFGNHGVIVAVTAVAVSGAGEGEGVEFGLREEAEVDERKRVDAVVRSGFQLRFRRRHGRCRWPPWLRVNLNSKELV